jgi:predicted deacetylase
MNLSMARKKPASPQKKLHGAFVLVTIFLMVAFIAGPSVYRFTMGPILGIFQSCKEIPSMQSSKMAILRIDDVQGYSLEDVSIKMMDDAKARDIPLSLGVIPKALEEQTPIYKYLKKNRCWLEIVQHGWDHQGVTPDTPEFATDKATAAAALKQGMVILENLTGAKITVFIPPLNKISFEAQEALTEGGIRIVSSEGSSKFDYAVSTFNYSENSLNSTESILRDCETRAARTSLCIVMMHPQDFVTDNKLDVSKYSLYLDTLESLKSAGFTFVRFSDFTN